MQSFVQITAPLPRSYTSFFSIKRNTLISLLPGLLFLFYFDWMQVSVKINDKINFVVVLVPVKVQVVFWVNPVVVETTC